MILQALRESGLHGFGGGGGGREKARARDSARMRERRGDRQIEKESERERAESWCAKRAQAREGLSRGIRPHFLSRAKPQ
jgi:hypothetical protein